MRTAMAFSLIDQAMLSAFNLALSLLLIAHVEPAQFGLFSYALTVLLIMTSLHNALIATPIGISLPGRSVEEQARVLAVLLRIDHFLRLAAIVPILGLCLLASREPVFLLGALAMCAFALWRETQRNLAFATLAAGRALAIDAVAVAASAVAIAALWRWLAPVEALLFGIASGNAVAVAATMRRDRLAGAGDALRRYRLFWHEARWSLLGAATTEAQFRGYVFAVQAFRGADMLGNVQAGRALMGPMPLLASAWARVARPEMTKALVEGRVAPARRILLLGTVGVMALSAVYLGALALAWPLIEPRLFHGRYPQIGLMSAAWGAVTLISMSHICLGAYLQAARQFRPLAFASVAAAAVSGLALLGLATSVPPVYAILAVGLGEAVAAVWILVLIARRPAAIPAALSPAAP